jgi:hypothetical protein
MNDSSNNTDASLGLEELVLKETLVSAAGLNADSLHISIKGDPSLRETTFNRAKYRSPLDEVFNELEPNLEELMLRRGTYRLYIGFNSGEIRTHSVFDPLREESHAADKLVRRDYLDRHFPPIEYDDKIAVIRNIYRALREDGVVDRMPDYWRNIMQRRSQSWEPMTQNEIVDILSTLKVLRDMPDFYLRNITICIVQNMVRMSFNCDGTQIISAENYKKFLQDNLPLVQD